jgi:hypothetical protein
MSTRHTTAEQHRRFPVRPVTRLNACIGIALLVAVFAAATNVHAGSRSRKAYKINKKHVEALGGKDTVTALEEIEFHGVVSSRGVDLSFTLWMKRPNKSYMKFDFRGQPIIQAYDGETAWWVNPFIGATQPQVMSEDFAGSVIHWSEFEAPLVNYRKKNCRADYEGTVTLEDNTEAYDIRLRRADGEVWHIFLDTETYLERKRTYPQVIEGETIELTAQFGDYRDVEGIKMPFEIRGEAVDGEPYIMTINSYEAAPDLDDDYFRMPSSD